jgi:hypothetical protein
MYIEGQLLLSMRTRLLTALNAVWRYNSRSYVELAPAANPTIVSYNVSGVKIYRAMSSLMRFEKK